MLFGRQGFGDGQDSGVAAIVFDIQGLVGLGGSNVLHLVGGWSHVLIVRGDPLFGSRIMVNAAGASAIGNVVIVDDGGVVDDRRIDIDVADDGLIHMDDCGVIGKIVTMPFAAREADAHVAKAVIHAAVVTDMGTPVALVKSVMTAFPAPVGGCPQRTLIGGRHPGSGNPEVAVIAPGPIAGSPQQVGLRAGRLFIDRQHRRRDPDTDTDGDLCARRYRDHQHEESKQKYTSRAKQSHRKNLRVLACLPHRGNRPSAERGRGYCPKNTPGPLPRSEQNSTGGLLRFGLLDFFFLKLALSNGN